MKKQVYNLGLVALLGSGVLVNAQTKEKGAVGVNTEAPQATLDVNTFDANGTTNEGIIAPKLTKERVANIKTPVEGTLVYVTNATYSGTNAAVSKIDDKGYYYFDGKVWVKAKGAAAQAVGVINGLTKDGDNVKLGGTLTEATDIALNGKNLTTSGEGKVGIGTKNPVRKLDVEGYARFNAGIFLNSNRGVEHAIFNYAKPGDENVNPLYVGAGQNEDGTKNDIILYNRNYKGGTNVPNIRLYADLTQTYGDLYTTKRLRIGQVEAGDSSTDKVLVRDDNGYVKSVAASELSGETVQSGNGLTKDGNNIKLGGTLTEATDIALNGKNLTTSGEGNIGIGTQAPNEKLEVSGNIFANEGILMASKSTDSGPYVQLENPAKEGDNVANKWAIFNMTGGYGNSLQFWAYQKDGVKLGSKLSLTDEGNLGIGIKNPSTTLDVNGSARIRKIGAGNPTTDQVLLADTEGNIKKAAVSSLSENLYTNDGTLAGNRTVNLDNKNLAFTGGQVGINTKEPKATFDIQANPNKTSVNDGILIPRVGTAKRNSYTNPENGLMVYNTDLNCYETNVGTPNEPEWQCLATAKKVQTLTIEPVGFIGNYRYGTINDPEEKKVLFKVTNNTNSTISGVDLSYVYVDGRTQYVKRGQNDNVTILGNSSKVLEYGISGGNWTSSVFTLTYDQYSSASITLVVDRENYLTNPDRQGTGDGGTATIGDMRKEIFLVKDNSASTPIDKTLTISADKPLKVKIPFTNGTGNYLGYTSPAVEIQDVNGKTREIQLSYVEGNLDIGKGFIEATIESRDGEDLTLPQTTLGHSLTIAQIPVRLNNKDKGTFDLIAFGGIPDKRFGDDSGHDFVYMTVTSPTGKVWLNNNLGAEYARIESEVFNPQKQAQSIDDINAFGSRYQYHRYSDGHELSSIVDGDYRENTNETQTLSKSFRPDDAIVIINPESDIYPQEDRKYNWVKEDYLNSHQTEWQNLWDGVNGANNPCPEGFRIPTRAEAQNEINYLEQKSDMGAFNSVLKFTRQLWLDKNNKTFSANPSNAYISNNADQFTNNVRCIKN